MITRKLIISPQDHQGWLIVVNISGDHFEFYGGRLNTSHNYLGRRTNE